MIVGFTGTRGGMSDQQARQLTLVLGIFRNATIVGPYRSDEFHFGGSGKSDIRARQVAKTLGYKIVWHPCPGVVATDETKDEVWEEVFPPLVRNRNIVAAVEVLIAAPAFDDEELRSGTWATTRYMQELQKPVLHLSRGERRRSATAKTNVSTRKFGKRYP